MSRYYYHGIKHGLVLDKALEIFQSGGIRCISHARKIGFNGTEFVSVCKKEPEEEYEKHSNNGFYNYVQNRICFIISNQIEAIKPEIIENALQWNRFELIGYMNSKPESRFSDMFDEWQVRGGIPFSYIIGIGIPYRELPTILTKTNKENGIAVLNEVLACAEALGLDIVDSSDSEFVRKYEESKQSISNKNSTLTMLSIVGKKYE